MLRAIRIDFDPVVSPLGLSVRLETLALAGVILLVLVVAGLIAGRRRARAEELEPGSDATRLRRDDLILIAFGAVPGAIFGGRLGYGLIHLDYYISDPAALLDPGKGGLSLTGALLLGTVTALAVGRLLGAPLRAWLNLAALPLLLGLGLGKLTTALGGSGQGAFSDAPWATSYVGSGAWGSLSPADPAIPSQILEGGLVLLALAVVLLGPPLLRLRPALRPRPSLRLAPARERTWLVGERRFLTAVALWAVVRFCVAFTWRDARVAGPLNADQIALAILIAVALRVLVYPWARAALSGLPALVDLRLMEWREARRERAALRAFALERAQEEAARKKAAREAEAAAEEAAKAEAATKEAAAEEAAAAATAAAATAEAAQAAPRGKKEAPQGKKAAPKRGQAAPEYPPEERGSEAQVAPERAGIEPPKRPRRGTHRSHKPKPPRPPRSDS